MKHTGYRVSSSQIDLVSHDLQKSLLYIRFKSEIDDGVIYEYENVSYQLFRDFVSAPSIGKFFGANIKNEAIHPFTKLEYHVTSDFFTKVKDSSLIDAKAFTLPINWLIPIDHINSSWSW